MSKNQRSDRFTSTEGLGPKKSLKQKDKYKTIHHLLDSEAVGGLMKHNRSNKRYNAI